MLNPKHIGRCPGWTTLSAPGIGATPHRRRRRLRQGGLPGDRLLGRRAAQRKTAGECGHSAAPLDGPETSPAQSQWPRRWSPSPSTRSSKMAGSRDRQKRRESLSGRRVPSDAMDAPTPDPESRLLERSLQPPQRIIAAHGHADIHFGQIRNGSQQHDTVQRLTRMVCNT